MDKKPRKKSNIRKEDIGTPTNFVHIQHVGFKPIKTRNLDELAQTSQSETDNPYEESDDFSSDEDKHPLVCTCPPEYSPYHKKDHHNSRQMATPTIPEHRDNLLDDFQQYSPPLKPLPPKPHSSSSLALNLIPSMNIFKSSKSQPKPSLPPSKIPRSSYSISRTDSTVSNNSFQTQDRRSTFSAPEDELPKPPTPSIQRRIKSPGNLFRRRSFSMHGGTLTELAPLKTSSTYRSSVCLPTDNSQPPNLATLGKSNTFVRQRRPLPAIPPPTAPVHMTNSSRNEPNGNKSDSSDNKNGRFSLSRGLSFTLTRRSNRHSAQRPLPPTPPSTPNPKMTQEQFKMGQSSPQGTTLPKLQVPLVPVSKVSPLTPTVWPLAPIPFVPLPQINDHGSTTGFVSFDTYGRVMSQDYDDLPEPPPAPIEVINLNHYRARGSSREGLPEPPPDPMEYRRSPLTEEPLPEPPPPPSQSSIMDNYDIYSTIKRRDISGSKMSLHSGQSGRSDCGIENFLVQESQLDKITKILSDKVFYSQWPSIMEQLFSQTNFRHFGESSSPSQHYTEIVRKTLELWLVMNPENSSFEALLKAVEDGRHKLAADTLKDSRSKIFNK